MKCPTIDKLSQYVDDLATEQEHDDLHGHVKNCDECQRIVEAFMGEQRFLKETLESPALPDDFASVVLDQLEPYEQKVVRKKRAPWKRIMISVAGVVLALGVSATLNPSFAEWIGGMFTTNQVDEGLRMATDAGLAERVNLEVMDNGITLKVEDVFVDSSRVALSYQILNENGKPLDTYLDLADSENKITIINQNGTVYDRMGTGWQQGSDYGLIEIPLIEQVESEKITLKFDLDKLSGVKGNWKLEVPIDLTKNSNLTSIVPLQDAKTSQHGVTINMKEIQFAPSSTELSYETGFTKEEQVRVEKERQKLESQIGGESVNAELAFRKYGTAIDYHLENEDKKMIYQHNSLFYSTFSQEETQQAEIVGYSSSGVETEQPGQVAWNESFIPQKEESRLTFVLDGVFKTVPSDFSVKFNPNELKKNPVSFEYEGNFITVKKAKKQGEYSLRKSIIPVERETIFMIEMEGGIESSASDLGTWILTDNKGNSYPTYESESILNKKDKNGRYKTNIDLKVYDINEIPEELTLHLVSVTRYEEVKDEWKIPLY
jgi:hypothetical protein